MSVIENILNKTWLPSAELGLEVPEAKPEEDCVVKLSLHNFVPELNQNTLQECFSWEFGDFPMNLDNSTTRGCTSRLH